MSEFILVKHDAKRAGDHYDLRFKMPKSKLWASFATPKGKDFPPDSNEKITLIRTHDHTEDEAKFTGHIESGYGAGDLKKVDGGKCDVKKFSERHIIVEFNGSKLKGIYQFVNVSTFDKSKKEPDKRFMFFKSKKK